MGARPEVLQRQVLRQSLATLTGGVVIGLALAVGAGLALHRLLLGIRVGDPLTLAASAGVVACAALLATYLPARRVSQLDPATGLREE
jgi:ABC-type antimicrobial peptide transport system permease subunit